MSERTDDLNIIQIRPLISPAVLAEELPTTSPDDDFIRESRNTVRRILLNEDETKKLNDPGKQFAPG